MKRLAFILFALVACDDEPEDLPLCSQLGCSSAFCDGAGPDAHCSCVPPGEIDAVECKRNEPEEP